MANLVFLFLFKKYKQSEIDANPNYGKSLSKLKTLQSFQQTHCQCEPPRDVEHMILNTQQLMQLNAALL
jgi:hypothetical protein